MPVGGNQRAGSHAFGHGREHLDKSAPSEKMEENEKIGMIYINREGGGVTGLHLVNL